MNKYSTNLNSQTWRSQLITRQVYIPVEYHVTRLKLNKDNKYKKIKTPSDLIRYYIPERGQYVYMKITPLNKHHTSLNG